MCTLIAAWQVFDDAPVAVAANRDEAHSRPFEPPQRRSWEKPVVAPKDCRAGGTWIGYNERGVVAALTNRWRQPAADEVTTRSRGQLVRTALCEPTTTAAVARLRDELTTNEYRPCHLFVADSEAAVLVLNDGPESGHECHHLDPGLHVVLNAGFDDRWLPPTQTRRSATQQGAAERIRESLRGSATVDEWRERVTAVVSDHRFGRCLHGAGFGTRSSSVVVLGAEPAWEFANGPPCAVPHKHLTAAGV